MQKAGKSGRRRGLVDMSASTEQPFQYKRPLGAKLAYDAPITLDQDGQSVYQVLWMYKGWVVDFSLTHRLEEAPGDYEHIARYDCCDSEVHKHQFYRDGREGVRTSLKVLDDPRTAWKDVDNEYYGAYDDMIDNADENYRRWSDGRVND